VERLWVRFLQATTGSVHAATVRRAANMAFAAWQKILDPIPLIVT
jgi:hypothetical protein